MQFLSKCLGANFVVARNHFGFKFCDLFCKQLHITACSHRNYAYIAEMFNYF